MPKGLLPFFHAFGYTATLWFPLTRGKSVVYAPNPLHTSQVGTLAMKYRVTHLLATPSFLTQYLRRIPRRHFESLRIVVTGADKSFSAGFDLEAQGAIEAAANANAFGPLPEGYPADVLPVSFFFDPAKTR